MSFWRTSPSAQEALQGRRDQRNPRSFSGSGQYCPAQALGLSRPVSVSILTARLDHIATYHRCALPSLLRTTPVQEVTSAGPAGTRTCEFHHKSLCSVAHSYRVDSRQPSASRFQPYGSRSTTSLTALSYGSLERPDPAGDGADTAPRGGTAAPPARDNHYGSVGGGDSGRIGHRRP